MEEVRKRLGRREDRGMDGAREGRERWERGGGEGEGRSKEQREGEGR